MSRLVFDIEADGLLDTITKVWCIVTKDIDTEEMHSYYGESLSEGLQALQSSDLLIGHNIVGYDIPALIRVYGEWERYPKVLDTLIVSRFLRPERKTGHSLEDWGSLLGCPKGDFHDWSQFSDEMLKYCEQDVRVNYLIFKSLESEYGQELDGFRIY